MPEWTFKCYLRKSEKIPKIWLKWLIQKSSLNLILKKTSSQLDIRLLNFEKKSTLKNSKKWLKTHAPSLQTTMSSKKSLESKFYVCSRDLVCNLNWWVPSGQFPRFWTKNEGFPFPLFKIDEFQGTQEPMPTRPLVNVIVIKHRGCKYQRVR